MLGSRFLGHPYGLVTGYYVKPTVFADVTNDSSTTLSKGSLRGKRGAMGAGFVNCGLRRATHLPGRNHRITNREAVGLRRQSKQECSQFRRGFELGHWIYLLEGAGERIRQAPHRPRRELLVLRLEIEPVDFGEKSTWRFQLAIHERGIENQLRPFVGDLRLPPLFHLAPHRFKASLDPIDTNG